MSKVEPVVEQAVEELGLNRITRRRLLGGVGLTSASLAASALLAACTNNDDNSSDSAATAGAGDFPETPKWKFVFVNHVTTNPFFTPTQYGAQDACALLNCEFQWTGSKDSIVAEMVNAMNTAISAKADGIAVAVVYIVVAVTTILVLRIMSRRFRGAEQSDDNVPYGPRPAPAVAGRDGET